MKKNLLAAVAVLAILAFVGWSVWPGSAVAARVLAQTNTATPVGLASPVAQGTPAADDASRGAAPVVQSVPGGVADLQAALEQLYTQVNPSVVNVNVLSEAGGSADALPNMPDLPFGHPGVPNAPDQPNQPNSPQFAESLGSGFIWDTQGHIVTNNHVVDGANTISVTFSDGLTLPAEIVGRDPESDLAVIKVDPTNLKLQPVQVADSTQVRVGQFVVAIGNPFGLEGSMSFGIVSALGRTLPASSTGLGGYTISDIIQTDAPVNPGNSGGALLDLQGRLVGVPTAIESPVRASSGVGFAIPSVIVQQVVPALIGTGNYEHPYLGISGGSLRSELAKAMNLPATQRGALVVTVVEGGPAAKAGLKGSTDQATINGQQFPVGGDVIIAVDGQPVRDFEDLTTYLARKGKVGQTLALTVLRDGKETNVQVTLGARPSQSPVATAPQPRATAEAPTVQPPSGTPGATTVPPAATQPPSTSQAPAAGSAWLGVSGMTVTSDVAGSMGLDQNTSGVLVMNVVAGSPADDAGLRGAMTRGRGGQLGTGGDVITQVNSVKVTTIEELVSAVQAKRPGDQITLTIVRNGRTQDLTVTLGERPANP